MKRDSIAEVSIDDQGRVRVVAASASAAMSIVDDGVSWT